eukprot:m.167367 g.167367  ORF g.167367 m.167367 type:complete len:54 (-) comp21125_c3_seq3:1470-1631(-)
MRKMITIMNVLSQGHWCPCDNTSTSCVFILMVFVLRGEFYFFFVSLLHCSHKR